MRVSTRKEPHLIRVPVLENALFLGLEVIDGDHCLLFRSEHHGQIQVWVQAERGGRLWFSYKQWDDRLGGTEVVYEGPFGDPTKDDPVFLDDD